MTKEADKLKARHHRECDTSERQKIKEELDQIPLSSSELGQVQQRESDRHIANVKAYREKRKQ